MSNLKNIDIDIDIDKAILNIDIDKGIWQNIDIDKAIMKNINIDKEILKNINIDKISNRLEFCISNRARCEPIVSHTYSVNSRQTGSAKRQR